MKKWAIPKKRPNVAPPFQPAAQDDRVFANRIATPRLTAIETAKNFIGLASRLAERLGVLLVGLGEQNAVHHEVDEIGDDAGNDTAQDDASPVHDAPLDQPRAARRVWKLARSLAQTSRFDCASLASLEPWACLHDPDPPKAVIRNDWRDWSSQLICKCR